MRLLHFTLLILLLSSCSSYFYQPIKVTEASIASRTDLEKELSDLPKPPAPVVVAVYKFKDQTGQYKPSEVGSSFSTAVTQGGTNILIKALSDSGWFKIIERENIGNLLNERKIIRQTRMQYQTEDSGAPLVNPLLFAGVIIEGGIVSYDSNILTGGVGVRYFGSGGSTAYRQDRVTVYIRAVATKTGEVLKNVTASKRILSQSLDGGVFRFVKFNRLLEAETGFTFNEPSDIAVTEAVQKAVYGLILEGIKGGLWAVDSTYKEESIAMMLDYEDELAENDLEDYLGVQRYKTPYWVSASLHGSALYYQGDFPFPVVTPGLGVGVHFDKGNIFGGDLTFGTGKLKTQGGLDVDFSSLDAMARIKLYGRQTRSPYIGLGIGSVTSNSFDGAKVKLKGGIGLDWHLYKDLSLNIFGEWNQFLADDIDGFDAGRYVDHYYKLELGVKYKFNLGKRKK